MEAALHNRSVSEWEALRPLLRSDLRFSLQEQGAARSCVIEDPAASQFHRVGLEEYCFLRSLDGTRTVAALLARSARTAVGEGFSDREAMQIISWARQNHLLATEHDAAAGEREQAARTWRSVATWLNPLSIKLPLGRPDRLFASLATTLRPFIGWPLALLWLAVLLLGAGTLAPEGTKFMRESEGLLARENWLWMLLGWVLLKVAHECGHGVACRHFGAPVREAGVIFILGLPMGYVDATPSLGLASKGRRITVAAAGLAVEFFISAWAAVLWAHTEPGPWHEFARNVVIAGTLLTLLFNANPLMRFDGYYILAELVSVPNLATRGRQWSHAALGWLLLGGRDRRPTRPVSREEWIVAVYGVAAWAWQLTVTAGLLVGASVVLRGGGLLFAVVAGLLWLLPPVVQFLKQAGSGRRWGALVVRASLLAALGGAVLFIPRQRSVASPGVVEFPETQVLRAECAGFAERVYVADGEPVSAGALLVQLRNEEATEQLARTRLELGQQQLRSRLAYTRQDVATFQAEEAKAESLRRKVAQQENYLATLEIRAPFAGRVTNRALGELQGRFFRNGEEVLRLGEATGAEVKIAVSQRLESHFRQALGRPLRVRVEGRGTQFSGTLTRLEARASREIAWTPLTALAGGPIPLRRTENEGENESRSRSSGYELAEPYFTATARLEGSAVLLPGETARVSFTAEQSVNLWEQIQSGVGQWLDKYAARE